MVNAVVCKQTGGGDCTLVFVSAALKNHFKCLSSFVSEIRKCNHS